MYVQSGGNVGIGTASPGTKLAIQSDANTSGAPANAQFYIQGTSSTAKRLSIAYNTSSNYGELSAETSPGVYSPIVLNPNGGSIGIGTALPGTLFDVAGSGNQNWISHFKNSANANGNDIYFGYTNTGTNATRGMYINGGGGLSSDFDLLVGALGKLTVTGAGNVGIGTTSPGSKLDVQDINNWNNGPAMNVTRTQNQNSSVGHGVKVDLTTAGTPASVNLY